MTSGIPAFGEGWFGFHVRTRETGEKVIINFAGMGPGSWAGPVEI